MGKVEVMISPELNKEINNKFRGETPGIIRFLMSLKESHHKGKLLTQVGGVLVKEIKYRGFRFYYVVDNYRLRLFDKGELEELLIRFVRMSNKKSQQRVIEAIKVVLRELGDGGF